MLAPNAKRKAELRKSTLALRDAMPSTARNDASEKLVDFANAMDVKPTDIVSGFFPIRSEIDLRPLMNFLRAKCSAICLPAVIDKETIEFRIFSNAADLVETGFGTFGPSADAAVVDPDVLLIPMAAFDLDGNRIGYGAGHYDRAIARLIEKGMEPRLIGMAFDCQRVDVVPAEVHDVPLHAIVTESGLHKIA